ncbi:MAG: DNA-3-methyladenine glycosylase [Gammaproteobacteria bacterium]|nr:DNA-3-methyladenine glycosylase [Gammaproteobacteria bacterium]MDE1984480.1 DNA-3-methyladenine glycosylase [Gammaproteobacteria bacterium]MDE2461317.1 DNA-3-methyladenine glycosylase [Gammaproteobacteria bacterium]
MTQQASIKRLTRRALPVDATQLARYLVGKTLVRELPHGRITGRIVETEAYLPNDAACHAFNGPTKRNHTLFLERGLAYVYFIYGNHFMLNVSAEREGVGAAVLFRALEPLEGIEAMKRGRHHVAEKDLARGPGRLAAALRVTHRFDGLDFCAPGPLWLGTAVRPAGRIGRSARIGIAKDAGRMLRFYERDSPFVSGPKWLNA